MDAGKARVAALAGRSTAHGLSVFCGYAACRANARANVAAGATLGAYCKKALQRGGFEAQLVA